MKALVFYLFLFCFAANGRAADVVGKPCPNFVFDSLINYTGKKVSIADLKGKHVILDFWGTFCGPCIADIPKLEGLQKKYGDKLVILMVVVDGYEKAFDFYAMRKKNKKAMQLPTTVHQKAHDYFNVTTVSTYVWIDANGMVQAVTDDTQMNEQKVDAFMNNAPVVLRKEQKVSLAPPGARLHSLADSFNVLYNSSLTAFVPGLRASYYPSNLASNRILVTNMNVRNLYQIAYGAKNTGWVPLSRTIVDVSNPNLVQMPKDGDWQEWQKTGTYCYELAVPTQRQDSFFSIMQQDLNRYFGYNAAMEKRVIKCMVLKKLRDVDFSAHKDSAAGARVGASGFTFVKQPFKYVSGAVQHYRQNLILVDETGIDEEKLITMTIQADMTNIESMNDALKAFGLVVTMEDRPIEFLVIKDKGK